MEEVSRIIMKRVQASPQDEHCLFIGTDSQNMGSITKIVPVIMMTVPGKGGIFFFDVMKIPRINSLRIKLNKETQYSLQYADDLVAEFEKLFDECNFDYTVLNISIHVDAGRKGATRELMEGISAWVESCGYDCAFKPNSCAASSVADRISK